MGKLNAAESAAFKQKMSAGRAASSGMSQSLSAQIHLRAKLTGLLDEAGLHDIFDWKFLHVETNKTLKAAGRAVSRKLTEELRKKYTYRRGIKIPKPEFLETDAGTILRVTKNSLPAKVKYFEYTPKDPRLTMGRGATGMQYKELQSGKLEDIRAENGNRPFLQVVDIKKDVVRARTLKNDINRLLKKPEMNVKTEFRAIFYRRSRERLPLDEPRGISVSEMLYNVFLQTGIKEELFEQAEKTATRSMALKIKKLSDPATRKEKYIDFLKWTPEHPYSIDEYARLMAEYVKKSIAGGLF